MFHVQIEPREQATLSQRFVGIAVSIAAVLGSLSLIFALVGVSPGGALWVLISTSFSSIYSITETLVKTTPIIFTGLAVACALKMKLWNIGAEGQLYMGAFGAVWAAQTFSALPAPLLIPLMMISGMVCGALLGGIVGLLKRTLHVNEILTSLMLNYVATSLVNYFIYGPWRDPANPGFPITARFVPAARLPKLPDARLHIGFLLAVLTAFIVWLVIEKTSWGYEVKATGESLGGAQYAGMPIGRNILVIFLICGAIGGLAGVCEVSGLHYKLQPGNVSSNYGSLGIIVAWLSNAHPIFILFTAFFTGILLIGSESLQVSLGISSDLVQIIIGLLLACILLSKFFQENRLHITFAGTKEGEHV